MRSQPLSAHEREALVRRALIRVKPEYFSWSPANQERYRMTMSKHDRFRLEQTVLKSLFDIAVKTQEELETALTSFTDLQYLQLNSTLLLVQGIGEDCFYLNEYLGDQTLLDFPTLYDYDYADHCFQEQAHKNEDPAYVIKPYRGRLYLCWARLFIDGAFYYATLSTAAGYLYSLIDELGFEVMEELIPHRYVVGKHHGKREGSGFRWDQRIEAGGKEAQLEELRERYWQYTLARYETLQEEFDSAAATQIFFQETSQGHDPSIHVIFSDKTALQAVRLRQFLRDCRSKSGDPQELTRWVDQEQRSARSYLEHAYQDIARHFDLKVIRLRKKRKILLSDQAAKDLL
jgi:hypothetical protein